MEAKRNTVQRQLIYSAVKELDIHASAEQVFEHVASKNSTISKATVYRNLSLMAGCGEIICIGNFDGIRHFDHNCHRHYHYICRACKKIFDVEGDFSDICDRARDTVRGFDVEDYNISFSGICWKCRDSA